MTRRNLEIPKTALVLKAAPLAALILLLCGAIAHTILHPNTVVASVHQADTCDQPTERTLRSSRPICGLLLLLGWLSWKCRPSQGLSHHP
jgi:hypothetical protein